MSAETPKISSGNYSSNVFAFTNQGIGDLAFVNPAVAGSHHDLENLVRESYRRLPVQQEPDFSLVQLSTLTEQQNMTAIARRIVQVFIADTNENVPLDESILYKGDPKLTDLIDNELFFEVGISATLTAHNLKRVKWLDKEATKRAGKDVFLDPAKIRDLKMVVVTIASF